MSLDLCVQITNYTLLVYFSGAHNLLFPLVSVVLQVLWSCLIFFWSSFSLDGPQASRVCYVTSLLYDSEIKTKQNTAPWKTHNFGHMLHHFLPKDKLGVRTSSRLFCAELRRGTRWVSTLVQSIAFVLSCPQPSTLSYQCLDSGRRETSPSDSSLKSRSIKHMFLSCLSLLREMPGAGSFF